jgi:hypothetical protein
VYGCASGMIGRLGTYFCVLMVVDCAWEAAWVFNLMVLLFGQLKAMSTQPASD